MESLNKAINTLQDQYEILISLHKIGLSQLTNTQQRMDSHFNQLKKDLKEKGIK
jgi:hypothetical protein